MQQKCNKADTRRPEMKFVKMATALLTITSASGAVAQQGSPAELENITACRTISDNVARLACFDTSIAALERARQSNELKVVSREEVRSARKSLFGLVLPEIKLFDNDRGEQISELNSTLRSATQGGNSKWVFVLDDGARWTQIDDRTFSAIPRAGQPIRIRRAAMGSYLANIGKQTAIRVRRSE
jgi:hypothetical protein